MKTNTNSQFEKAKRICANIFFNKMKDYGLSWRLFRPSSITDQIYIKLLRIRSIEEKKTQKVKDKVDDDYVGIFNYAVIAIIQLELIEADRKGIDISQKMVGELYKKHVKAAKALLENKNHDYGEAWRKIRVSSITDLMIQKIMRLKQIEENEGKTIISEGLQANYYDLINYSVFSLIRIGAIK